METVDVLSIRNISHNELKEWVQKYISPNLKDIGELGSGIEFCLGTYILFPCTISLKKIRVGGLSQYDKYHNFKCLQAAFNDLALNKVIPMEDMMKMTFRDNFYFGCWFKTFFEANYEGQSYDMSKLISRCRRKHTNLICNCPAPAKGKDQNLPVKFNVNVKASMFQYFPNLLKYNTNNVKMTPKAVFVGKTRKEILDIPDGNRAKSTMRRPSSLNRPEKSITDDAKVHQFCVPCFKTRDPKSLREILACKSDSDFSTKKRKCPPLTGGCVNQADLCRSLNEAMTQIRKALITVRAGLYQKVVDDLDKHSKDQCESGRRINSIEFN